MGMDCRLCGRPSAGIDKMTPCETCQIDYPEAKRCRTCGRFYPDSSKFEGDRCISCEKRLQKRREEKLLCSGLTPSPGKRKLEAKTSTEGEASGPPPECKKRLPTKKRTGQKTSLERKSGKLACIRLKMGHSLPIKIGDREIARIMTDHAAGPTTAARASEGVERNSTC